ncbi:MAG: hypothetical protein F6J97_05800 [Leptolyngbya sp. SIO4C1]|nr:hypothetical protein [Leptolyngbya sp. SIO4C1]
MNAPQSYILLLGQQHDIAQAMQVSLGPLPCTVIAVHSIDQALAQMQQNHPSLVILSGSQQNWSETLVQSLRNRVKPADVTIVALTEPDEPRWSSQEDPSGLDGFLVKPLSGDILNSLLQSALVKTRLRLL